MNLFRKKPAKIATDYSTPPEIVAEISKGAAGLWSCRMNKQKPNENGFDTEIPYKNSFDKKEDVLNRRDAIQEKIKYHVNTDDKKEIKAFNSLSGLFTHCLQPHKEKDRHYLFSTKTGKVYPNATTDQNFIISLQYVRDSLQQKLNDDQTEMNKINIDNAKKAIDVINRAIDAENAAAAEKAADAEQHIDIGDINVSLDGQQKNKEEVPGGKSRRRRAKSSKRTKRSKARKSGKKSSKRSTRKTRRNRRSKH